MSLNFLDFEQPIAELEAKIDSLTAVSRQDEKLDINIDEEVHRLREKSVELTRVIKRDMRPIINHPVAYSDRRRLQTELLFWHARWLNHTRRQFR